MFTLAHSRLLGIAGGTLVALSLSSAYAQSAPPYDSPYRGYAPSPYAAPYWQDRGPWFVPQYGDPYGGGYGAPQGVMPPPWARFQPPPPQGNAWGAPQPNNAYPNAYPNAYQGNYGPPPWAMSGPYNGPSGPYAYGPSPFRYGNPPYPYGYGGPTRSFSPAQSQPSNLCR